MNKSLKIIIGVVLLALIIIFFLLNKPQQQKTQPQTSDTLVDSSVNIGILQAFTGPIESLTPPMAASAELAINEASASGVFLGGKKIKAVRADSTCIDAAAAVTAAERLINVEKVIGIVGASCSGATTAVVSKVSAANGVLTISSSATAPGLSHINDNGYFFRTAPSDARQGQILANIVIDKGVKRVAITYTNNDYGKGLSESFIGAYKKLGGEVTINSSHEDDKADYSAEVGALSASGADTLVVFGYVDKGGRGIVQASLDSGAFEDFIFADGMVGENLTDTMGADLNGSFATMPGSAGIGTDKWKKVAKDGGVKLGGPFLGGSYDAAALIILAAQASNSTDRASIKQHVMEVANAPGVKIFAGELKKGLEILAQGKQINYVGADDIEFSESGDIFGSYQEMEIINGKFTPVKTH